MGTRTVYGGGNRFKTTMDLTGPFFETDPTKTLEENARRMLAAMAAEGQADVRAQIRPHNRQTRMVDAGYMEEGVFGRVNKLDSSPFAKPSMVVSAQRIYPWGGHASIGPHIGGLSADSTMVGGFRGGAQYRGGKLEKSIHMFRRTAGRMRRSRKLNAAELLKGLT